MYEIEWTNKAFRQLRKIRNKKFRETIYNAVTELKNLPNCANVKKLKSRKGYRLKVQNWRVIFDKKDVLKIIEIQEVKKRDERTYS